jgi:siroheme synthase (precorrin-2 oxidase/ferrochelatase)
LRYYPVFLDLDGQLCIVLGDGKFAVEKAAALREAGANVRMISSRDYRPGALAGARLVVDASEDPEVNRQSWDEAERASILINVVDRPAQCRFIAPAIVRRDPLLIAISTSGESPFLASMLRARIERWLGQHGGLAVFAGRLIPGMRCGSSFVAGTFCVPYPTFVIATAASATVWWSIFLYLGSQLARWVGPLFDSHPYTIYFFLGLIVLSALVPLYAHIRMRRDAGRAKLQLSQE